MTTPKPCSWDTADSTALPKWLTLTLGVYTALVVMAAVITIVVLSHSGIPPAPLALATTYEGTIRGLCEHAARDQLRTPASVQAVRGAKAPVWNEDHWNFTERLDIRNASGAQVQQTLICTVASTAEGEPSASVKLVSR